ncbi:MAG: hypothetical protein CMP10_04380 [Zetaproteobacteria bacterium]|nr:hypothetical protein [Pseudobdellovibrionaceae bacterium]
MKLSPLKKIQQLLAALTMTVLISSCLGRIDDRINGELSPIERSQFGLTDKSPLIISFGAGWCKPCRKEIDYLNQVVEKYDNKIELLGLVVEGTTKGSAPDSLAITEFIGKSGNPPRYPTEPDPEWATYDAFQPAKSGSLPLLVFINQDNRIVNKIQRSMNLENELYPIIDSMIAGKMISQSPTVGMDPPELGDPSTDQDQSTNSKVTYSNLLISQWSVSQSEQTQNRLQAIYMEITEKEGFEPDEFTFGDGKLRLKLTTDLTNETTTEMVTRALWSSASGCQLTIWFKENLKVNRTEAICN